MAFRTTSRALGLCLGLALALGARAAGPVYEPTDRNLYEWSAVAPMVVVAAPVDQDGRWYLLDVETSLRGDLEPGTRIRVDRKSANRERGSRAEVLKFDPEARYVVLLEPSLRGRRDSLPSFDLARGVRGVRALPPEGADAVIDALREFVAVQDLESFDRIWARFRGMLDGINPIVTETVLDQYLKFDRGEIDLLPTLEPLLDHPRVGVRARAARLIGGIVERAGAEDDLAVESAYAALRSRARRDASVEVRVEATRAIGKIPGDESLAVLEVIAEDDPDQEVRYAAERILLERRQSGEMRPPRRR